MEPEIPWPRPGDVLFADGDDWLNNACVGWSRDEWGAYADGYKLAADIAVRHVVENGRDQDRLVFPVAFLYRQYIEVRLKHLLRDCFDLLDVPEKVPTDHRIGVLWSRCRPLLAVVWPNGDVADLDAVGDVIRQFVEKDPRSTAFRYPTDLDGKRSLPLNERINLRNLAEVMDRTAALLDACSVGLAGCLDWKREAEAEWRYEAERESREWY